MDFCQEFSIPPKSIYRRKSLKITLIHIFSITIYWTSDTTVVNTYIPLHLFALS